MPYSIKHNVLFIHIPKCAGKSFETALDIAAKEENTKYIWRSFLNKVAKVVLKITADQKALARLWGVHDYGLTLQHLTYQEIELLSLLDKEKLKASIKVAIVRNPYERAISSYKHMKTENQSFLSFVKEFYSGRGKRHNDIAHRRTQSDYLRNIKGEIIVDNIIRFESLEKDYSAFLQKNNLTAVSLPHIGSQNKRDEKNDFYCKQSRSIISKYFESDFKALGYKLIS